LSGDIGNSGTGWSLNGNVSFVSDVNVGQVTDNNRQNIQDGYALIGARFQISGPDDQWSFAIFGNNLTDKGYCNTSIYQVLDTAFGLRNGVFPGSTGVRCNVAQPRTYGASATFKF
jgi:iron complex outermembrane receptor protein